MGPASPAFRGSTGAEWKALEAGTYFLCWSGILGGWEVGEKSSQIAGLGMEVGGSRPMGPVLSFLTACSPLLRSGEADLVDRTAYPLGEGGAPLGQSPLCL